MSTLHCVDMAGRCFKCGEVVGSSSLIGCKAEPYKSPREIELEADNAALLKRLDDVQKSHFTLSKDNAGMRAALENIIASSKWSGTPPTAYANIARAALAGNEP